MKTENVKKEIFKVEKERTHFKALMAKNTNYFGNFPKLGPNPIFEMQSNQSYESLCSIGYNPDREEMQAIVNINRSTGYNGNLCTNGSLEHVRFYLDYGNGDGFIDQGAVGINVHDIPSKKDCNNQSIFPLTYSATLKRKTKEANFCKTPLLPKLRVILSWNLACPANEPNWKPAWGGVMECEIQIKPVIKLNLDLFQLDYSKYLNIATSFPNLTGNQISKFYGVDLPEIVKKQKLEFNPEYLKELANSNFETQSRVLHKPLYKMIEFPDSQITLQNQKLFSEYDIDFSKLIDNLVFDLPIDNTKADVSFEELECVGLNYYTESLVATVKIKRPNGYSGDLCHAGSKEYISFWIDWKDDCEWTYLQTTEINVHDIKMDSEDLCYSVSIPLDAKYYRKICEEANVVKVRSVLSWNKQPSTVDPNKLEYYGNRVDAHIQIRPGKVLKPGEVIPYLYSLGGVNEKEINSIGLTSGESLIDGKFPTSSVGSPFAGIIDLKGKNFYKPNHGPIRYKIKVENITTNSVDYINNDFEVDVITPGGQAKITQKTIDNFYTFLNPQIYDANLLASFIPGNNDLLEITLEIEGESETFPKRIQMDNDAPVIKLIVDDDEDCRKFTLGGDPITGEYSAQDKYIKDWKLGSTFAQDSTKIVAKGESNVSEKKFSLTTDENTYPCGKIWLSAKDKRIIDSSITGRGSYDEKIICLQPKTTDS